MDLPPEEVQAQLAGFEELLTLMESKLQPFVAPGSGNALAQLVPQERAHAQLALAHATAALYQLFLKASGVDPADHEFHKEQERLKQYTKKVRKVAAEKELRETKRSMEVNVSAVNRFISAAVPNLTREQKAALATAGQAAAAAANAKRKRAPGAGGDNGNGGAGQDAEGAAAAFLQETMAELQPGVEEEAAAGGGPAGSERRVNASPASGQKTRKKGTPAK